MHQEGLEDQEKAVEQHGVNGGGELVVVVSPTSLSLGTYKDPRNAGDAGSSQASARCIFSRVQVADDRITV